MSAGFPLHTRVDGAEGAPWLVLSNALGASLAMWDLQMPLLTQNYRVLRYDTRGHGQSGTPPGPYRLADLTGDLLRLLDAYRIERAAFMGLSMGGLTGLGLAIHHPDRLSRVVCAGARADTPAPVRAAWDDRIAKVEAGGLEAVVDSILESWLTADWRQANAEAAEQVRLMVLSTDPAGYIACCQALRSLDDLKDLSVCRVPVHLVGGALDHWAPPEVMQAMAAAMPDAAYVSVPDAAQVANLNQPLAFNRAIGPFLGLDP